MLRISMEALRSRSLAGFPVLLIAMLLVLFPSESSRALGQGTKLGTTVGQVNGTPSASRGQTVRIDAGLSAAPRTSWGYWSCLSGPVKIYVARGSRWVYLGQANAVGCSGGLNSYATATFRWQVPRNQPRGHQRFKFEYPGNPWYLPSFGFGSVWVP
jgi:hypothetical protein